MFLCVGGGWAGRLLALFDASNGYAWQGRFPGRHRSPKGLHPHPVGPS